MKTITIIIAAVLALAGCSVTESAPDSEATTTTAPFIGPTVPNPQPLTVTEKFILDYRSMKPGDTRTDTQVASLLPLVCDNQSIPATLIDLQGLGYTTDESGWIVANTPCEE